MAGTVDATRMEAMPSFSLCQCRCRPGVSPAAACSYGRIRARCRENRAAVCMVGEGAKVEHVQSFSRKCLVVRSDAWRKLAPPRHGAGTQPRFGFASGSWDMGSSNINHSTALAPHQHTTMGRCSATYWTAYSYLLVSAARCTTTLPPHVS